MGRKKERVRPGLRNQILKRRKEWKTAKTQLMTINLVVAINNQITKLRKLRKTHPILKPILLTKRKIRKVILKKRKVR